MLNNGIDRNAVKPISNYYENPETIPSGIFTRLEAIRNNANLNLNQEKLMVKLLTACYNNPFELIKFPTSQLRNWKQTHPRDIAKVLKYLEKHKYIKIKTPYDRERKRATAYSITPELIRLITNATKYHFVATSPQRNGYRNAVLNCIHNKAPLKKKVRFDNFETLDDSKIQKEKYSKSKIIFRLDEAFLKLQKDTITISEKKDLWRIIRYKFVSGELNPKYSFSNKTHRIYMSDPPVQGLIKYFRDDPRILRFYNYSVDIVGSHPSIIQAMHGIKPTDNLCYKIAIATKSEKKNVKNVILPVMNGQGLNGYIATQFKIKGIKSDDEKKRFQAIREAKQILNNPNHPKHKKAIKLKEYRDKVIQEAEKYNVIPKGKKERQLMNFFEAEIIKNVIKRFKGEFINIHDCLVVKTIKEARRIQKLIAIESEKILNYYLTAKIVKHA